MFEPTVKGQRPPQTPREKPGGCIAFKPPRSLVGAGLLAKKHQMQPFKTFRLGGDLTKVYDPANEKGSKGS